MFISIQPSSWCGRADVVHFNWVKSPRWSAQIKWSSLNQKFFRGRTRARVGSLSSSASLRVRLMFAWWCVGAQSSQFASTQLFSRKAATRPWWRRCNVGKSSIKTNLFCLIPDYSELHASTGVTMKTEEKNSSPKVRIAVLGNMNVGKSGELCKSTWPVAVASRSTLNCRISARNPVERVGLLLNYRPRLNHVDTFCASNYLLFMFCPGH